MSRNGRWIDCTILRAPKVPQIYPRSSSKCSLQVAVRQAVSFRVTDRDSFAVLPRGLVERYFPESATRRACALTASFKNGAS
jgi:hypothetical protein